jgi:hypothetical protein
MAYTIRLIALECLRSEELDGDEVYIKCNGAKIWEAAPDKMHSVIDHDEFVNHFDFAEGRKQTKTGWVALQPFKPEAFAVRAERADSVIQLWEADLLNPDELLGQTPVDASQASGGSISVVFQRLGANYRLTYRVEA